MQEMVTVCLFKCGEGWWVMNQEWHEERHSENEYEPSMRSCIFYTGWLWSAALPLTPRAQTFASVVAPSHQAPTVRGMPPHQPPLCCKPAAAPPPQFCHEMPRRVTSERLLTYSLISNSGQLFIHGFSFSFCFLVRNWECEMGDLPLAFAIL